MEKKLYFKNIVNKSFIVSGPGYSRLEKKERYFSESELIENAFLVDNGKTFSFNAIDVDNLNDIPAANVKLVNYAHWVHHYFDSGKLIDNLWYCSECAMCGGKKRTNYCPHCGARMKEEEK